MGHQPSTTYCILSSSGSARARPSHGPHPINSAERFVAANSAGRKRELEIGMLSCICGLGGALDAVKGGAVLVAGLLLTLPTTAAQAAGPMRPFQLGLWSGGAWTNDQTGNLFSLRSIGRVQWRYSNDGYDRPIFRMGAGLY
jgi:hypothetical protein